MAVTSFMVSTYARNIYLYGNRTFESIPVDYHIPVKQYAAANYTDEQIANALNKGWITQQVYDETMAYKAV